MSVLHGLAGSLLYLFIGGIFVSYMMGESGTAGGKSKKKPVLIVISVLVVLIAVKLGIEFDNDDIDEELPNCYETLGGIGRYSTLIEIRAAYKEMGRKYHPDKNREAGAETKFLRVKKAYDILMDEKSRDTFHRFGEAALAESTENGHEELVVVGTIVGMYLFWVVATYLATVKPAARVSRTWTCLVGIALLAVEGLLRMHNWNIARWVHAVLPPSTTEHELLNYCHSAFPAVILILRTVSEAFYVDLDAVSTEILLSTSKTLQDMSAALALVAEGVSEGRASKKAQDQILALRTQMDESNTAIATAMGTLKTNNNDPLARYYWYLLMAAYALTYM